MKKNITFFLIILMLVLPLFGCGDSAGGKETPGGKGYTKSDMIKSVKNVGYMSGPKMEGYQFDWLVKGSDLGHPIYDGETDTMYFAHGDSFNSEDPGMPTMWRSNVMAYIENISTYDFAVRKGGIDGYVPANDYGVAKAIIEGFHTPDNLKYEVTKIPRGGIVLNGNIYMWYMSVSHWGPTWMNNYSGVVKSVDGGKTWERLYDLTWVRSATENAERISDLATQTIGHEASGVTLNLNNRVAPNFMQMSPVDGKDGYIYIFGLTEGIHCNLKMARVAYADIEDFEKYQYYYGRYEDGTLDWRIGSTGLKLANGNEGSYLIKMTAGDPYTSVGEVCVFYNEYLKKWIMSYHLKNATIQFRVSDNVCGPYSDSMTILDIEDYPFADGAERTYAGFSHEKLAREGGKKIYMMVSLWKPYQSYWIEVEFD